MVIPEVQIRRHTLDVVVPRDLPTVLPSEPEVEQRKQIQIRVVRCHLHIHFLRPRVKEIPINHVLQHLDDLRPGQPLREEELERALLSGHNQTRALRCTSHSVVGVRKEAEGNPLVRVSQLGLRVVTVKCNITLEKRARRRENRVDAVRVPAHRQPFARRREPLVGGAQIITEGVVLERACALAPLLRNRHSANQTVVWCHNANLLDARVERLSISQVADGGRLSSVRNSAHVQSVLVDTFRVGI
mmetsp:Transcript_52280/g.136608  ORF Transcript_52280/g.136608 Transcript_52280/m.136608 type:complete len:245 (+) Transcript_52280:1597-2331(+)